MANNKPKRKEIKPIDLEKRIAKDEALSLEEQQDMFKRVNALITLAQLLVDASSSCMLDAESLVRRYGVMLKYKEKQNHKKVLDDFKRLRKTMKDFCDFYNDDDVEEACQDSDDLYDIARLYADHSDTQKDVLAIKKSIARRKCNKQLFNVRL